MSRFTELLTVELDPRWGLLVVIVFLTGLVAVATALTA